MLVHMYQRDGLWACTDRDSGPIAREALSELGICCADESNLNMVVSLDWNSADNSSDREETDNCGGSHLVYRMNEECAI